MIIPKFAVLETLDGWMVSVPPSMSTSGKRVRRFFAEEKAAKVFAGHLRAQWAKGQRAGILDATMARDAQEALELLRPHGLGLREAARQALEALELLRPLGLSLGDAARMALRQAHAAGSVETLAERWLEYCRRMEPHWRPRYANDMGKVPRWVGPELMKKRVCEITPALLAEALRANGATAEGTLKMRAARVNAAISNRGGKKRSARIAIMTVRQCAQMLRAARGKEQRWAVALLLFAGIRPSAEDGEITRLDWSAVGETEIYVAPEVSKTGSDRHIPILPRLARLLRGRPAEGPVIPVRWKLAWQRMRRATGVKQQDISRHTFASMFLAATSDREAKQAMGHTASSDTLLRFYRRAVLEAAGRKYFGLPALGLPTHGLPAQGLPPQGLQVVLDPVDAGRDADK